MGGWVGRSVGGSVGQSVGGSVGQSVSRSVGRWVGGSEGQSVTLLLLESCRVPLYLRHIPQTHLLLVSLNMLRMLDW